MKKYERATETCRYEYVRIVEKTNCTDKIYGHQWEWIFKTHPEYDAIKKQYPHLYGTLTKCSKCGKVSSSM